MKFDVNKLLIEHSASIVQALDQLNSLRNAVGNLSRLILFVTDKDKNVIGSLTDGDIRRSIVMEKNLEKEVGDICNKDFVFISHKENAFHNLSHYQKKDIKILPVLDNNNKMVDIIDLEYKKSILPLECMIMAGGRGKRLSPLTDTIPKPMLDLGGKPIIEHNIDRLIAFGIKKIYISVKYLGQHIVDYLGDGREKGIEIEYVWEEKPLGTAGALALVDEFKTDQVLLMNSDLFTNVDFESLFLRYLNDKADIAVASTEYKVDIPYAIFQSEGNTVKAFKEKPSYRYQSNAGIYILDKKLIHNIPKNQFCDITDVMDDLIENKGKLVYDPIIGYWIDIGKPTDYEQAQEFVKHLSNGR